MQEALLPHPSSPRFQSLLVLEPPLLLLLLALEPPRVPLSLLEWIQAQAQPSLPRALLALQAQAQVQGPPQPPRPQQVQVLWPLLLLLLVLAPPRLHRSSLQMVAAVWP